MLFVLASIAKTVPDTQAPPRKISRTNSNTPSVPRAITAAGGTGSSPQLSLATHALQSQQSKDNSRRFRQPRMSEDEATKLNGPLLCSLCNKHSERKMQRWVQHVPSQKCPNKNSVFQSPYKMERPQAAVDLQPLSDHLRASVPDPISILQHTSESQQLPLSS